MAETAFEAITSRQAWYASEPVAKYDCVMLDATGKYAKADGSRPFAGIVQYGAEKAGEMCTVVRGTFPAVAASDVAAGDLLQVQAGKVAGGASGAAAIGIALTAAAADELVAVSILESPAS